MTHCRCQIQSTSEHRKQHTKGLPDIHIVICFDNIHRIECGMYFLEKGVYLQEVKTYVYMRCDVLWQSLVIGIIVHGECNDLRFSISQSAMVPYACGYTQVVMMETVSPLSSMSYLEHCFGMLYNVCFL
jgi:hypothetical protein